MNQQQYEMFGDYNPPNRSPVSNRGYGQQTLHRQPSRNFDQYTQVPAYQTNPSDEAAASRYETASRFDNRMATTASTLHGAPYGFETNTWGYNTNGAATIGGASSRLKSSSRRAPLPAVSISSRPDGRASADYPQAWQEPPAPVNAGLQNMYMQSQAQPMIPQQQTNYKPIHADSGEELIPTAIVIKNIPFAIKKESIVEMMTDMSLPLPYAFNYHFDNGVFRGLAFANFQTPDETALVIAHMNHLDVQGRKLRVEYKKMLPQAERERIERDKRERRGQLEEQHRPVQGGNHMLHSQASMSSLASAIPAASPSPISMRSGKVGQSYLAPSPSSSNNPVDIDMNDPVVLEHFATLKVFENDPTRQVLRFAPGMGAQERKHIHTLAYKLNMDHISEGAGPERHVIVSKIRQSPPLSQISDLYGNESTRRSLNRAATTDFSEARNAADQYNGLHTLNRQHSALLDIPPSPSNFNIGQNLRGVKSFADLRSQSPSFLNNVSNDGFPSQLGQNVSRYNDYGGQLSTATSGNNLKGRDDFGLSAGFGSLSLQSQPTQQRSNGRLGAERDNLGAVGGVIGSQRTTNGNYDNMRNGTGSTVERQPRGPTNDWGSNFSRPRQNGHGTRGSNELDNSPLEERWEETNNQFDLDRNGQIPRY